MQLTFIVLVILNSAVMLSLFVRKSGLQLQYLRIEKRKAPGKITDFVSFNWQDADQRVMRMKAFLLFPMLYPVLIDEEEEDLNAIKGKVKRTHVAIYLSLILFIILAVYSEKVFPS
jgi:hypothetical protein